MMMQALQLLLLPLPTASIRQSTRICVCALESPQPCEEEDQVHQRAGVRVVRRQNVTSVDFGVGISQEIMGLKAAAAAAAAAVPSTATSALSRGKETEFARMLRERPVEETDVLNKMATFDEIVNADESGGANEEIVALKRSVVSKRKLAEAAMVAAMGAGKFGPTYSNQAVRSMPHFLDWIIMKAVLLKRKPSYAHLSFSTRARFCIDESKVVQLIRWLRHNNLTVTRIGELISFSADHLEIIRPRIEWLKKLHVNGRDLGVVLSRQPSLLIRPFEELNHTVAVLENAGLKREWMGVVISRSPGVLVLSHDRLYEKIEFFVDLGIDEYQFGAMAYNFPSIVGRLSTEEMETKVEFLKKFGLDEHTIGRMIVSKPQLLMCSIEDAWQPIVKFLYHLGIERGGMERILAVNPAVFCLDLAENITPKVQYLKAIGVNEEVIGQVIVDFPAILTYSLDRKIRPVVRFLLETAGVSEDKVGHVIAVQPEIIGCSITQRLEQAVKFYLSLGIQSHELGEMIAKFPMLVKYSPPILLPKYRYYKRVMQRPLEELIRFPRFFSYSLETRIAARHEILAKKGLKFRLKHMLACTDDEFAQRVQAAGRGVLETEEDLTQQVRTHVKFPPIKLYL